MQISEIRSILMDALPLVEVHVSGDDCNNFQIIAVGEIFSNLSNVKKQQTIYAPLMQYIVNKHIHAISIKTYTPKQWQSYNTV